MLVKYVNDLASCFLYLLIDITHRIIYYRIALKYFNNNCCIIKNYY